MVVELNQQISYKFSFIRTWFHGTISTRSKPAKSL